MDYKEFTARTIEEAITLATVELGITSDHLEYSILDKGSGGILGFGRKDVTIKAREKSEDIIDVAEEVVEDNKEEENIIEVQADEIKELSADEIIDIADKFLAGVFSTMDMVVKTDISYQEEDKILAIELSGDEMGILIGKRGQTLDALQYLTSLAVNRNTQNYIRVKMDTEDYRNRRKETLENLARNISLKVKRSGKSVHLEAMNPYERRTIHFALQNDDEVTTFSEGEEPYRHVVVALKR